MGSRRLGLALGWVGAMVAAGAARAALPDLVPAVPAWRVVFNTSVPHADVAEGCASSNSGIDLLRFTTESHNIGTADLHLGDPMCPPCGQAPGEPCGNPDFICSPPGGHNHAHYENFALYELLDTQGSVIVTGRKQGFCLLDSGCTPPAVRKYTCTNQGITAGCWDTYDSTLGCQYLEVTGLPPGSYTLRVTIDPVNRIEELDDSNNQMTVPVRIPDPSGSACNSAVDVPGSGGTFSGATSGASTLSGPCGNSGSSPEQVFRWTPSVSGTARIQTCSATGTNYDTVLYLRAGGCSDGTNVACNDDTAGCATTTSTQRGSVLTPSVTAGQTYYIVVDGYGGASGNFVLTVTPPSGTPSSACDSPVVIPASGGVFTGTTAGASTLSGSCGATGSSPEKVFQWTPTVSGAATIQTCSSSSTSFDTVVYLRGANCLTGSELACNDDTAGCATTTSSQRGSFLTPNVTAGETYFIVVDGYGGAGGQFRLEVNAPAGSAATPTRTPTATATPTSAVALPSNTPTATATPTSAVALPSNSPTATPTNTPCRPGDRRRACR